MDGQKMYNTKELAEVVCLSVKWVEKWRSVIAGARRVGRLWRFDRGVIDARIARGLDLRVNKNLDAPGRRKYITPVHGAVRGGQKKGSKTHGA
jgi:hypothetical protein